MHLRGEGREEGGKGSQQNPCSIRRVAAGTSSEDIMESGKHNSLRDPGQTPDLLLLQLEECIEDAVLELLQERHLVEVHFVLEEVVLQARSGSSIPTFLPVRTRRRRIKERPVLDNRVNHRLNLVDVVRSSERHRAFREEPSEVREQPRALVLREGGAERVDGDVERATVAFEGEDGRHDVGCGGAEGEDEGVEVFEVRFVEL